MKHLNKIKFETVGSTPSNSLIKGMRSATAMGTTENGAPTFTRSGSALLDFYAQAGAMRKNPEKALELFQKAFSEDRQSAIRILFYLRDVRGGQGERDLFRTCLEWLGTDYPEIFENIIGFVAEYGRWDDLFFDNDVVFRTLNLQLANDTSAKSPSLLAKWMPTINASSAKTKAKAKFFAQKLGLDPIRYRIMLRDIRRKIATVEAKMSANKWEDINYSGVPSQASRIYRNAFSKHDTERYGKFIEKAEKGEVKINAATLYPYQIYNNVRSDYSPTLEALWNQLPDYTQGKNGLVLADVSGSMEGDPMSVSVSLALYFAERNKGAFKDYFMTFSSDANLQKVQGKTLREKMRSIESDGWCGSTNIQAAFDAILGVAVNNNVPADEMPSTLYIISDMEFDNATHGHQTNFEVIKKKYAAAGYTMPSIVFWNVDARSGRNLPVERDENGVAMVSGFSPVIFKMVTENKSPEQVMFDTINAERYAKIVV